MIGKTVSHYRIVRRLGSGGMGVVYEAQDTRLARPVALKFLPDDLISRDAEALERFRREARTASALNHPGICVIYDIGQEGNQPFIVMEFMKGETLRQRLERGTLKIPDVLDITTQLAEALDAAHEQGILHRDIKPENIFITDRGHAKILDFGLAKLDARRSTHDSELKTVPVTEHLTGTGAILGTLAYMSPEQARGEALDRRSDLFSLGAVMYEMATGHPAFDGETPAVVLEAILNRNPSTPARLNPQVPQRLEEIIQKLLDKDRKLRYQTASDLAADLRRMRRDSGGDLSAISQTAAKPPSLPQAAVAPRKSKAKPLIFTVAAAAVVAIGAFLWVPRGPALTEKDPILIADFVNSTGDPMFDVGLRESLEGQLSQSPYLNIFSEDRVRDTLRYMDRSPDDRVTDTLALDICRREGLKAVLSPSITAFGDHYPITLKAVNCATGDTITVEQREAESKEQVLTQLGQAASSLRAKLGESLASIEKFDTPIEKATTSSLEALRAFTEGRRLNSAEDFAGAVRALTRAVEYDQNFAMGYYLLGTAYQNLQQPIQARQNITKSFELRERGRELERLSIEANYYRVVLRDILKANEIYERIKQTYPRDFPAELLLGVNKRLLGRFSEGLEHQREAVRLSPRAAMAHSYLSIVFLQLNRLDEAKTIIKTAIDQKVETPAMHSTLYQIAFIEGDADAMKRELEMSPEQDRNASSRQVEVFYGRLSKVRPLLRQANNLGRLAMIEAVFRNEQQALAAAQEALKSNASNTNAAAALALIGKQEGLRAFERVQKDNPDDTVLNFMTIPIATAAFELRSGNATKSLELLNPPKKYEPAFATLPGIYIRGLAYLQTRKGSEAAGEFQRLLDNRGVAPLSELYPLAKLGLGRAYALNGDLPKARKAYQDFFDIWKDADQNIPILAQAKGEYERLPKD